MRMTGRIITFADRALLRLALRLRKRPSSGNLMTDPIIASPTGPDRSVPVPAHADLATPKVNALLTQPI